jgi:hypothetical protein
MAETGGRLVVVESNDAMKALLARMASSPEAMSKALDDGTKFAMSKILARTKAHYLTGGALKVRTGRLRKSITATTMRSGSAYEARFYIGTQYGWLWEFGGRIPAYKVEPKDKKALSWVSGGKRFFSKGHMMPARNVAARPFLRPAYEDLKGQIRDFTIAKMREAYVK